MERRRPHNGIQIPDRKINGNKLVDLTVVPHAGHPRFFGLHELTISGTKKVLCRGTARQCWDWAWDNGYFIWGM